MVSDHDSTVIASPWDGCSGAFIVDSKTMFGRRCFQLRRPVPHLVGAVSNCVDLQCPIDSKIYHNYCLNQDLQD